MAAYVYVELQGGLQGCILLAYWYVLICSVTIACAVAMTASLCPVGAWHCTGQL